MKPVRETQKMRRSVLERKGCSFLILQRALVLWLTTILVHPLSAQYDPHYPEPLPPLNGNLFLHGGGSVSQEMREAFTQIAGGKKARIVIIPTADVSDPTDPSRLDDWQDCEPEDVRLLHATSREEALTDRFSEILDQATGVWFSGGKQGYLVHIYEETPVIARIQKLIQRGGIVGGTSAGAAIASTPMLIFDRMQSGFEFLPGTIVDQHFLAKNRLPRLLKALESHPSYVGFGIDENTALLVKGRRLEVMGRSTVTVCFSNSPNHEADIRQMKPGDKLDLIALRRFANRDNNLLFPLRNPRRHRSTKDRSLSQVAALCPKRPCSDSSNSPEEKMLELSISLVPRNERLRTSLRW